MTEHKGSLKKGCSLVLNRQEDFALSPEAEEKFRSAAWHRLKKVGGRKDYRTEFKAVYSDTGLYFLFRCEDKKISCSFQKDGEDLYTEDVLELFLQPDDRHPLYLEYELSPLGRELVLMVSHNGEAFYGWLPFHYKGERKVEHITWGTDGEIAPGALCDEWRAMLYLPFALFEGTVERYPEKGTVWRGNLFRIDYDDGEASRYAYAPACGTAFHDFEKFEEIIFG